MQCRAILVRLIDTEHAAIKDAAHRARVSMNQWIVNRLLAAAADQRDEPIGVAALPQREDAT